MPFDSLFMTHISHTYSPKIFKTYLNGTYLSSTEMFKHIFIAHTYWRYVYTKIDVSINYAESCSKPTVVIIKISQSWFLVRYIHKFSNWIDRITQSQFYIYWDKGSNNHADYYTKHWPASYHQQIRPTYILQGNNLQIQMNIVSNDNLRGCVENPIFGGTNPTNRVFNI